MPGVHPSTGKPWDGRCKDCYSPHIAWGRSQWRCHTCLDRRNRRKAAEARSRIRTCIECGDPFRWAGVGADAGTRVCSRRCRLARDARQHREARAAEARSR